MLEGFPHNKVHNYIGGVGPLDPGPYGNMTNFLSPVDPISFLHHSNMDRLWDVWERKQKRLGLPWLPAGADYAALASEPFLFFVDANGNYVNNAIAGQFLTTARFEYDYEPGFGETLIAPPAVMASTKGGGERFNASRSGAAWSATVPPEVAAQHLESGANPLIAEVTFTRPSGHNDPREFDVLINAPDGVDSVGADSPFFAGTVAFIGPVMTHMDHEGSGDATFAVPIPRQRALFSAVPGQSSTLRIRVVPSRAAPAPSPTLKAVTIRRQ